MLRGCCGKGAQVPETHEEPVLLIESPQTKQDSQDKPVLEQHQSEEIFSQTQSQTQPILKSIGSSAKPLPELIIRPIANPVPLPRPGSQTSGKKERVLHDDYCAQEHRYIPELNTIDRDQLEENTLVLEAKQDIERLYGAEYVDDEEMIRALVEKKRQRIKVDPKALQRKVEYKSDAVDQEEEEIKLIMKIKEIKQREQKELLEEITRDAAHRKQLHIIKNQKENEDESELLQRNKPANPMQQQLQKEMRKGQRSSRAYEKPAALRPLTNSKPKLEPATSETLDAQNQSLEQESFNADKNELAEHSKNENDISLKEENKDGDSMCPGEPSADDKAKELQEMLGEV